jgi:hypothetical protein
MEYGASSMPSYRHPFALFALACALLIAVPTAFLQETTPQADPTDTPVPTLTPEPTATLTPSLTLTPMPEPPTATPEPSATPSLALTPTVEPSVTLIPSQSIPNTAEPTPPAVTWAAVFADAFAVPDVTAWQFTGPGWQYDFADGRAQVAAFETTAPALFAGGVWADAAVEITADLRFGRARLLARHVGGAGYEAVVSADGTLLLLRSGVAVASGALSGFTPDIPQRLRLSAFGPHVVAEVVGVGRITFFDPALLPPGQVGFAADFAPLAADALPSRAVRFDDAVVYQPWDQVTTTAAPSLTRTPTPTPPAVTQPETTGLPTATPAPSATLTLEPTLTHTSMPTPTETATSRLVETRPPAGFATMTLTLSLTLTFTPTPSPTLTFTPTPTASATETATATPRLGGPPPVVSFLSPSPVRMDINDIVNGAQIGIMTPVRGWAYNSSGGPGTGPGITLVRAHAGTTCGGPPISRPTHQAVARPDVVAAFGLDNSYLNSGYLIDVVFAATGSQSFTVCASRNGQVLTQMTRTVTVVHRTRMDTNAPLDFATVTSPVLFGGWAFDDTAGVGAPGVSAVRVYSGQGCTGTLLGTLPLNVARPDVVAAFGLSSGYAQTGFQGNIAFSPGQHTVSICAVRTTNGVVGAWQMRRITVPPTFMDVNEPLAGATVSGSITVGGWAYDTGGGAGNGPGVSEVRVFAGSACTGTPLLTLPLNGARPDVVTAFGLDNSYRMSGFRGTLARPPGAYTLSVCPVRSANGEIGMRMTRSFTVVASPTPTATPTGTPTQWGGSCSVMTTSVSVPGIEQSGVDTGIDVLAGQVLAFTATGTWYYYSPNDPVSAAGTGQVISGFLPGGTQSILIGTLGSGYFGIGTSASITAATSGRLRLLMNDVPGLYNDNGGSVLVQVQHCAGAPTPTVTPTPTPTANSTATATATNTPTATPSRITIFFAGSIAGLPLIDGPLPLCQSPIWVDGSEPSLPVPDLVIPYFGAVLNSDGDVTSGGKMGQVNDAFAFIATIQNPEILLIGYSAGADAALMFADEFVQTNAGGRIAAVVMLGGTLSGYSEFRGTGIRDIREFADQSPAANLYDEVVISVLSDTVPILAFDDDNGQFSDLWGAVQTLQPPPANIALLEHMPSANGHFGDEPGVIQCINGGGTPPPNPSSNPGSGTNVNTTVRSTVITWLQARGINSADY